VKYINHKGVKSMTLKRTFLGFLGLAAAAYLSTAPAKAEMASGVVLANTCFSCHGTNGKSRGDMPSIAGKSKGFIVSSMKNFRSGKRPSTVMMRISKGFTDAEIDALASYFSEK
jgi:sulfide dehydrogenase cytochrome subunit